MWVTSKQIVEALGGQWHANAGTCHCPAHDDDKASLSITETREGKTLLYCHAGCANFDVILALRERGLWGGAGKPARVIKTRHSLPFRGGASASKVNERAVNFWRECKPVQGTAAEAYLRQRAIKIPIPPALRYHNFAWHRRAMNSFDALVAGLDEVGYKQPSAVQMTYLEGAQKASLEQARMNEGDLNGSAVRLAPIARRVLGVAESTEDALSVIQLRGIPCWSVCGAKRFSLISIPKSVRWLLIFRQNDRPGIREAEKAADHFKSLGLRSEIIAPPAAHKDWNALLMGTPS